MENKQHLKELRNKIKNKTKQIHATETKKRVAKEISDKVENKN